MFKYIVLIVIVGIARENGVNVPGWIIPVIIGAFFAMFMVLTIHEAARAVKASHNDKD